MEGAEKNYGNKVNIETEKKTNQIRKDDEVEIHKMCTSYLTCTSAYSSHLMV